MGLGQKIYANGINKKRDLKYISSATSGKDNFGGIHTHFQEHIKASPQHKFNIIELNAERKYLSKDNITLRKYDVKALTGQKYVTDILSNSEDFEDFFKKSEPIISEYQNALNAVGPDIVFILGTSIPSYYLLEAAKREGLTKKILHSYAGILEKEIGGHGSKSQNILKQMGRRFTEEGVIEDITYIFPSELARKTVEEIHDVKIPNKYVVPNGISKDFKYKNFERIVPEELSLGFVGRLSSVKNPDLFLEINNMLDNPAKLKIITDIYAGSHKAVGQSLLKKMTQGEVFYYHPRSPEKLSEFYRKEISVNIVPSLFETFCNVATESLSSGTPTILSDRAGSKDVFIKYGLENLIFSIEDPSSFRRSLEFAKSLDYVIPKEISEEIYEELKWENIIERYNNIAQEVANK